jgi:hypothetical protein
MYLRLEQFINGVTIRFLCNFGENNSLNSATALKLRS